MVKDIHSRRYHPELPSFQNRYVGVDTAAVQMAYRFLFQPPRQRYITGGLAVQFYCTPEQRRGSNDIDIMSAQRLTPGLFKQQMMEDFSLDDEGKTSPIPGFQIELFQHQHDLTLHVCNWYIVNENKYFVEFNFPKLSGAHFERMRPVFEREFANAIIYEHDGLDLMVLDPVDIVSRKLIRVSNYYDWEHIPRFKASGTLKKQLGKIWKLRKKLHTSEVYRDGGCNYCAANAREFKTKLRAVCDSYDIRLLFASNVLDEDYFEDVMRVNEKRGLDRRKLEVILSELCPEFSWT